MRYFAQLETENIASEIEKRVEDYRTYIRDSGILNQLRTSHAAYYTKSNRMESKGAYGEYSSVVSNEYANLIRNLKQNVQSSKPAWDAKASNSDSKSLQSAQLANGILDYVMTDQRCETNLVQALQDALVLREGWILTEWDSQSGDPIAVDETGFPVKTGDIKLSNHNLLNVARDFTVKNINQCAWKIVTEYENKYELAARFPAYADSIMSTSKEMQLDYSLDMDSRKETNESDLIPIHTFFHDRTAQVPNGRMTIVVCNKAVFDGDLPYSKVPLVCMTAENKTDSPFGWSLTMDLLPLQDAQNMLLSTVVSNNKQFGVQTIASPKGSGISVQELSEGLNLLEFDGAIGAPQPLQLTASAPETYNLLSSITQSMERLSGVSQLARGSVSVGQLSGSAMAVLQSQAIQFSSQISQSYTQCLEDVGTMVISHYQRFQDAPRVVQLAGKTGRATVREFSNQDLNGINRVTVSSGNPLSKTLAGRLEVAKDLLSNGLVKTPEEYLQVLTTGNLQPILEAELALMNLIRSENEDLQDGKAVSALITDQHDLHIKEHLTILSSPESRANPQIVALVLGHIQEHKMLWESADPMMLQLSNTPPPAMQPPQMPAQEVTNAMPAVEQEALDVNQPNMPMNPVTGQRFDPSGQLN